jgi:hypothetical protein
LDKPDTTNFTPVNLRSNSVLERVNWNPPAPTGFPTSLIPDGLIPKYIPFSSENALRYDPGLTAGDPGIASGHYMWNPHPADFDAPAPGFGSVTTFAWTKPRERWTKLSQLPKGRCLGVDVIYNQGSVAHRGGGKTSVAYFNLAFPDGSVQTIASSDLFVNLKQGLQPGNVRGQIPSVGNGWTNLNDSIRVLELISQGKNPRAAPGGYFWWEPAGGTVANQYYPPAQPGQPAEDVFR